MKSGVKTRCTVTVKKIIFVALIVAKNILFASIFNSKHLYV